MPPLLSFLGVSLLAFLLGAWIAWRDLSPFPRGVRPAFVGLQALWEGLGASSGARWIEAEGTSWREALRGGVGLRRDSAEEGLTLLMMEQSAHLVDLEGNVRHSWQRDYDTLPPPPVPSGDRRELAPEQVVWYRGRVLPNGDLLVLYDTKRTSPQGLALARLDRNSQPLWVHYGYVHHDFDIGPDGRIFVLAQSVRPEPPRPLSQLRGPILDETLQILSPDGRLLREVSLLDAFASSVYAPLVNRIGGPLRDRRPYRTGDYLHSNNVDIVGAATRARIDELREGQALVSMRNLGVVALVDLERSVVVWARRGEWFMQHDPDFLENGNLLIYDNQGDWDREGRTRVIEVDPGDGAIVWQYPGGTGGRLLNRVRGDQQRLTNGNTLINEQDRSRVIEVTRDGDLAWEYLSVLHLPNGEKRASMVFYAQRYLPGSLDFPFNEGQLPARYLSKETPEEKPE